MPEFKKNPNELGCLWIKSSSRGEYLSGTINGQSVVVFKNARKVEGSNQPDWLVMKPQSKPKTEPEPSLPVYDDDVPFMWLLPIVLAAGVFFA